MVAMRDVVDPAELRRPRPARGRRRRIPADASPLAGTPLDDLVLANLPDRLAPPRPADVDRRPRVGVVLGAGGVLGNAYLAGAMAAIWEVTGFEPRTAAALVGTSAGSVHAACYGAGMPALFGLWRSRGGRMPDSALADLAEGAEGEVEGDPGEAVDIRDMFVPARALPRIGPASASLMLRAATKPWSYRPEVVASGLLPEGMLSNGAVGRVIRRMVPSGWTPHPRTWIVALNLRTGERTVFGRPGAPRAHLDRAVRASCAIPGFYRPVRIGRDRYVDGGAHSPSNADLLRGLDLDLAIIINPMSSLEGHAAAGLIDRYLYPIRRKAGRQLAAELRLLAEEEIPTLVIHPTSRDLSVFGRNLMDPRPRHAVAEMALETTRDALLSSAAAGPVLLLRHASQAARSA